MAPTAVNEAANGTEQAATPKAATDASKEGLFNIFYSPQAPIDIQDGYKYDHLRVSARQRLVRRVLTSFQPSFPEVDWPTLEPVQVEDRGFFADPNKSRLLAHIEAVGGKIKHINPTIGTEITGVDIRTLGPDEKDDL
jgi:sulfonate dioxygenase